MSDPLIVEIEPPSNGGMTLALSAGAQCFRDNFTFKVFPFLSPLVEALRVLQEGGYVDEKITLLLGAPQLEIRIYSEVGDRDASLCVDFWPDSLRSKLSKPPLLFSFSSTRRDIVLAFVGALKRLRASASDPVLTQEYGSWFPTAEYERLLAAVE